MKEKKLSEMLQEVIEEHNKRTEKSRMHMVKLSELGNAVAYCQGWARALKSDPQAVFYAAAKGQAAHDYILGVARNATSEGES